MLIPLNIFPPSQGTSVVLLVVVIIPLITGEKTCEKVSLVLRHFSLIFTKFPAVLLGGRKAH